MCLDFQAEKRRRRQENHKSLRSFTVNREKDRLDDDRRLHLVLWKKRARVVGSSNHISWVEKRQ